VRGQPVAGEASGNSDNSKNHRAVHPVGQTV